MILKIFKKRKEKEIEESINKHKKFLHDDLSLRIRIFTNEKTYDVEIQKLVDKEVIFKTNINERLNYKNGQIVAINFVNDNTGLFETKIRITNKRVSEFGTYYTGEIVTPIEKKQLRDNYRLPININVSYTLLPRKLKLYNGIAKDISSGGMLMESTQFIPTKKQVRLVFEVGKKMYKINGTIMRVREDEAYNKNIHHIRFDDLSKKGREELHKFVFNEQKRRLKNGVETI